MAMVSDNGSVFTPRHWFEQPAITFYAHSMARRPGTAREWLRCLWNADLFFGRVPFLKCVALISWLIAWLA